MSIWKKCLLGDFVTLQRGFDILTRDFKEGIYKVIFSSGLKGTHNEFKVKAPGVVIGRKGTLGKVFYIDSDFWPTDTTLWVKNFHGNDPKFVYFFLQTLRLEQFDCGSANPTLNRNHIHPLPVTVPPLPIQRKIAGILSAYDDLIENNTRRIEILEEMARMLYREWFVKFRFPVDDAEEKSDRLGDSGGDRLSDSKGDRSGNESDRSGDESDRSGDIRGDRLGNGRGDRFDDSRGDRFDGGDRLDDRSDRLDDRGDRLGDSRSDRLDDRGDRLGDSRGDRFDGGDRSDDGGDRSKGSDRSLNLPELVESELGLIPKGWEVKPIGEVIETLGGGTPSTNKDEYWLDGDIQWFVPKNLTSEDSMFINDSEKKITELGLKKSSAKMFPAYSVMMTSRATLGVKAINTKPACTNQGFITCIPNEKVSAYQIYFWIEENMQMINNLATGATFKEITKTNFRNLPILIADNVNQNKFLEKIEPICKQIEILQNKNINLRKTRDLLLPRLISGEIDVENLDINIGEVKS